MRSDPNTIWISADRRTRLVYDPGTQALYEYVNNVLVRTTTPDGMQIAGTPQWNLQAAGAPTSSDNEAAGYSIGSFWPDQETGTQWWLIDPEDGVWMPDTDHPGYVSGRSYLTHDGVTQTSTVALSTSLIYVYPFTVDEDLLTVTALPVRVTTGTGLAITGTANNGAGAVRLTVSSTTGLTTGETRVVSAVTGTTEANGTWVITVVDGTHVDLVGSVYANAWISGGVIHWRIKQAIYGNAERGAGRGRPELTPILEAIGHVGTSNSSSISTAVDAALLRKRRRCWMALKVENNAVRGLSADQSCGRIGRKIGRTSVAGTTQPQGLTTPGNFADAWPSFDETTVWTDHLGQGILLAHLTV